MAQFSTVAGEYRYRSSPSGVCSSQDSQCLHWEGTVLRTGVCWEIGNTHQHKYHLPRHLEPLTVGYQGATYCRVATGNSDNYWSSWWPELHFQWPYSGFQQGAAECFSVSNFWVSVYSEWCWKSGFLSIAADVRATFRVWKACCV